MKRTIFAAAALAMLAGAPAFAQTQPANPQQITGTVKLDVTQVTSMAQLRDLLQSRGYSDILLTTARPNLQNPRPDLQAIGRHGITDIDQQVTPVHPGWSGTAVLNGHRVSIVVG